MNEKVVENGKTFADEGQEESSELTHPILFGLGFGLGRTARAFAAITKRVWQLTGKAVTGAVKTVITNTARNRLASAEEAVDADAGVEQRETKAHVEKRTPSSMDTRTELRSSAVDKRTPLSADTRTELRSSAARENKETVIEETSGDEGATAAERSSLKDRLASREKRKRERRTKEETSDQDEEPTSTAALETPQERSEPVREPSERAARVTESVETPERKERLESKEE